MLDSLRGKNLLENEKLQGDTKIRLKTQFESLVKNLQTEFNMLIKDKEGITMWAFYILKS